MTARLTPAKTLLTLQWTLAAIVFEIGLVQVGLPFEELQRLHLTSGGPGSPLVLAGLLQALAAVLLVVPSITGFLPSLTPLAAAGLAVALGAAGAGYGVSAGLGMPLVNLALALGCSAVFAGRVFVAPVPSLLFAPETRDPWHVTPELLERRRRHQLARAQAPTEAAVHRIGKPAGRDALPLVPGPTRTAA
jgi:hypothetical protein